MNATLINRARPVLRSASALITIEEDPSTVRKILITHFLPLVWLSDATVKM